MILASAIATACVVNAANFTWGFYSDSIQDSAGDYISGGTALLYLGTVTASESAFDTSSAVLLATAGQDPSYYNYGNFDNTNLSSSDDLTSTAAGQAYTLILLEETGVTSLDGYEGKYIITTGSSAQGSIPGVSGTTYYGVFQNDTAYGSSDWASMAPAPTPPGPTPIPEPTSGLLLLLGVAGLALRRKQA